MQKATKKEIVDYCYSNMLELDDKQLSPVEDFERRRLTYEKCKEYAAQNGVTNGAWKQCWDKATDMHARKLGVKKGPKNYER